uniref:ribosomal protein S16 n=1 Tax=Glaucosphaera vacuolata TaxID=38265 RepID=UPI001FCD3F5B|nr:ribosomal protein S16 [Glaucosphaera vacuolata]UNJ18683.1 ribosomal protein S16 [Glaucosphaera vacuolata]
MLKIRLKRYGRKKLPIYRIVVMNNLSKRDGRSLEELGLYNPNTNEIRLNIPRIQERLKQGAQPTDTIKSILQKYL